MGFALSEHNQVNEMARKLWTSLLGVIDFTQELSSNCNEIQLSHATLNLLQYADSDFIVCN